MREKSFYINFQIGSPPRFDTLHRFFTAVKAEKDRILRSWDSDDERDQYDPSAESNWREFLDEGATEWFADTFDFHGEEGKTFLQLWQLTEPDVRLSHPMFNVPGNWDFDSMIEALFNGEYVLVNLVKEMEENGVLYYDPWAGPFGGTEPLVAMIESFGHVVTFDSWHEGPHHRRIIGWDYSLAKELVAAGKGFTPD